MDANDQAFPTWTKPYGGAQELDTDGMTIRTYLAAKAMAAIIINTEQWGVANEDKEICKNAVKYADALIAELSKP